TAGPCSRCWKRRGEMGEACAPPMGAEAATKIHSMATVPAIDVKELRRRLDAEGPKPYLLDVREPWEYMAGHVPGAQLIPLGELEQRVGEVPREGEVLAICHSGQRSLAAAGYLRHLGYTAVSNRSAER